MRIWNAGNAECKLTLWAECKLTLWHFADGELAVCTPGGVTAMSPFAFQSLDAVYPDGTRAPYIPDESLIHEVPGG